LNAFYATQAGWYSYEDEGKRNSVFTRFLLAGLAGAADANRDGVITLGELAAWLPNAVSEYALAKGIRQKPFVSLHDPAVAGIPFGPSAGNPGSAPAPTYNEPATDQFAGLIRDFEKAGEVMYATNFRDSSAKRLGFREGGKIEVVADRAIATGTGYQGGGGLIISPIRIERNTRVTVLFTPAEDSGFAFDLMEMQDAGPLDCRAIMLVIESDSPSITKRIWRKPWEKTQPMHSTLPWDSREIRYLPGKPLLAVYSLDSKGILTVKLNNERGKADSFTFDQAFVNAPMDFFLRSYKGRIELQYLSIVALD